MSKIPCKYCGKCKKFHAFSHSECPECGMALPEYDISLKEVSEIPTESRGELDEKMVFYVQKCPGCGTLNYTEDKEKRVRICRSCLKSRVKHIDPVLFVQEEKVSTPAAGTAVPLGNKEDEDGRKNDRKELAWCEEMTSAMKTGQAKIEQCSKNTQDSLTQSVPPKREPGPAAKTEVDDEEEDEDEEDGSWNVVERRTNPQKEAEKPRKKNITFTALVYGRFSFTIRPEQADKGKGYLLGRFANQREFLSRDGRVGNEHCYIQYRGDRWIVQDNWSRNGTFVNAHYIERGQERPLENGDVLTLGHKEDSMSFRVTIA